MTNVKIIGLRATWLLKSSPTIVIVINEFAASERSKAEFDVSLSILCRGTANGQFSGVI